MASEKQKNATGAQVRRWSRRLGGGAAGGGLARHGAREKIFLPFKAVVKNCEICDADLTDTCRLGISDLMLTHLTKRFKYREKILKI